MDTPKSHLEVALGGRSIPFQSSTTRCQTAKWSDLRKKADQQEEALKLLLALGGAGLGGGMLARSLVGVNSAMSPPSYNPLMYSSSVPTPVPVPIFPAPKKKKPPLQLTAQPSLAKAAEALRKEADVWDTLKSWIPRGLPGDTPTPSTGTGGAAPTPPTPPGINPLRGEWGIPASMLAAGTGLVGGWHLMGGLIDKTKTNNVDTAVHDAEEDYQKALAEQYRAALRAKNAEDTLGIDDLFDAYVKKAEPSLLPRIPGVSAITDLLKFPISALGGSDATSQFTGATDAATLAAMLGTGYMTHNWVKKRNTNKILEKAVQLRARQRQFTPAPFYAVPEQISERA